jgi:hypothetical protein
MRYNDPSHFARWKTDGTFPKIHDALAALMDKHLPRADPDTPTRFLDLCCSIGLLGQRIRETRPGSTVVGVEGLRASIEQARAAGITYPILHLMVTRESLPLFAGYVGQHRVEVIVARRCLCEIFGKDQSWARLFLATVKARGVRYLSVQGMAPAANSVHPLPSIAEEVALFGPDVEVMALVAQCAILRIR